MFKKIINLSVEHSSLSIMTLGSLSIFIANLGFKNIMSVDNYYQYSIIITVLSLLTSFGVFGVEQVFLRLSIVTKDRCIEFDSKLLKIALFSSLFSSLLASAYFIFFLQLKLNGFIVFFLSLGVIFSMLFYNVFRLASQFFYSQSIQNSWRLTLGLLAFYFYFFGELENYLFILTVVLWFVLIIAFLYLIKNNRIKLNRKLSYKEIFLFSFHFCIALLTLSFLAQGDRFFVEYLFSKKDFGDYFYLGTLYLFPFSLLQSYVGFKELVYIKNEEFDVIKKLRLILKVSLFFTLIVFMVAYLLIKTEMLTVDFKKNILLIFMFLIMGNIKIIYSLFSAIISVKASLRTIKKMNIIFMVSSLIIMIPYYFLDKKIIITVCIFILLWIIRLLIWALGSRKYIL